MHHIHVSAAKAFREKRFCSSVERKKNELAIVKNRLRGLRLSLPIVSTLTDMVGPFVSTLRIEG